MCGIGTLPNPLQGQPLRKTGTLELPSMSTFAQRNKQLSLKPGCGPVIPATPENKKGGGELKEGPRLAQVTWLKISGMRPWMLEKKKVGKKKQTKPKDTLFHGDTDPYVAENDLELLILLTLSPKCSGCRCTPLGPVYGVLVIEPRASCQPGRHLINYTTSPALG